MPQFVSPPPRSINVPASTARTGPLREPEALASAPAMPAAAADPVAATPASEPAESPLGAMVGRARGDAGSIDRELRQGKPGVPEIADTPWGRFRETLAAAHIDRGLGVTSETYTAPDGQVIYRFRRGGKYKCRSSGSVGPKIGGAVGGGEMLFDVQGGAGRAGEVQCPLHAEWKRD